MHKRHILFAAASLMVAQLCLAADPARDSMIREEIRQEEKGDLAGAMGLAKKILATHPNDVQTLNTIAGLYGKMGKFADEIVWAKKAIVLDGNYHLAYVNMGNALFYQGHAGDAKAAFEKAKALAPRDPLPVYSLGSVAESEKNFPAAIDYFQAAVALDPTFESGLFSLAAMYASVGRLDEALATVDTLLSRNPHARDAIDMRNHIKADLARSK